MRALLHRHGHDGTWGNLGLWNTAPEGDYAHACAALARKVGRAAGLKPGDRVWCPACGAGDELLMWTGEFDAAQVHAVEQDPELAGMACGTVALHGRTHRVAVLEASALDARAVPLPPFDRVLCVDAAYHLSPRAAFLKLAFDALKPGGRLAYTDLLREPTQGEPTRGPISKRFLRASGIAPDDIAGEAATVQRLAAAGFTDIRIERLDAAVLDGFTRFVWRHSAVLGLDCLRAGWRRPLATALMLRAARSRGLGYGLIAASRPLP